jgi:IrrE N-terminal-like domain
MESHRYETVRNKATALRTTLGIELPWLAVVDVIEFMLPQILPEFEYEIAEIDDLPGKHALAYPRQKRLVIRSDVYDGACNNNPRDRFTLAHEIGHLFLHQGIRARQNESAMIETIDTCEIEANIFGMELMMPSPIVLATRSARTLADLCGVSHSIAIYQWVTVRKPIAA